MAKALKCLALLLIGDYLRLSCLGFDDMHCTSPELHPAPPLAIDPALVGGCKVAQLKELPSTIGTRCATGYCTGRYIAGASVQ